MTAKRFFVIAFTLLGGVLIYLIAWHMHARQSRVEKLAAILARDWSPDGVDSTANSYMDMASQFDWHIMIKRPSDKELADEIMRIEREEKLVPRPERALRVAQQLNNVFYGKSDNP